MMCPLSGQPCNQPKNIHVTEMVNGQYNEMNLCHQCAGMFVQPGMPMMQQLGMMPPSMPELKQEFISPMELLTNPKLILAAIFQKVQEARRAAKEVHCPSCGTSMAQIAESSRLGCAECYRAFPQLVQVIKVAQDGHLKHVGKRPKNREVGVSLDQLKKNMELAVKEERYEEAAKLRDEIKKLSG